MLRSRFGASRIALKTAAAAVLRTDPEALDLSYTLGGKPYLRGLGHLDVSLAHAGDLIAVGVSGTGRIGVDLEPTRRRVPVGLLMDHICTAAEKRELARLERARRAAAVLRLWTLKEAYTKALGQGLRLGFTEFGFGPDSGLRTPEGAPAGADSWDFGTFPVRDGWLLSVACEDVGAVAALEDRW
ncbi:4'-phosphopantetheinyl transferase family protein [Streptomyces sp. NPDC048594]|uniref:4'-phosphopantetheinyl transferase family protein n=1 Tax=Streptomyces sp. NPDC048594 TaxID=3365575 RepID=UPI00371FDA53